MIELKAILYFPNDVSKQQTDIITILKRFGTHQPIQLYFYPYKNVIFLNFTSNINKTKYYIITYVKVIILIHLIFYV